MRRDHFRYPLVIASRYNIPFLLDKPGTGNQIRGEIYRYNVFLKKTRL